MRIGHLTLCLWVVLSVPAPGVAQPTTSPAVVTLGWTVGPGNTIFVTDRNGVQTGGRLVRLSPCEGDERAAGPIRASHNVSAHIEARKSGRPSI